MDTISLKNILEWSVLILILLAGVYAAIVIKNEKKVYIKNAKPISFNGFILLVPHWWGNVESNNSKQLIFKRLDTRYDWEAVFHWEENTTDQDLIELFKEKINDRKILFDEENAIIHNPASFENNEVIKTGNYEMLRLEGTATQDRSERLYYDAFLIRNLQSGHYMYAESKSSVLNGLVEGPYFEEVMMRLELA